MLKKLLVVILAAIITTGFWFGSQLTVKQKLKMTPVIIAAKDIPDRTQITDDMVLTITLPITGIPPGVAKSKDEVVGKYTMSNYGIPKNGYFFNTIVKNASELPDGAAMMLNPGEELVSMSVDLVKYLGGNAVPGSIVNLWFSAKTNGQIKVPVVGRFCENVRVLGAKDQKAMETIKPNPSETTTSKDTKNQASSVAKVLLLAMPKEDVKYFFMAQASGQVYPTGNMEDAQVEQGSLIASDVTEARKWLDENIKVLSGDHPTSTVSQVSQAQNNNQNIR